MKTRSSCLRSAFTLIELLVVIAIIAILASLVLATAGYVQEKAGRSRAEAEIAAMSAALESYKVDNGEYPRQSVNAAGVPSGQMADGEKESSNVLITTLFPPPGSTRKVYFEVPDRMLLNSGSPQSTSLIDAFGNVYYYQFPGRANRSGTNFFDLWSTGRIKNNPDEAQWIKNW